MMDREKDAAPSLDYVLWPDRASSYLINFRVDLEYLTD